MSWIFGFYGRSEGLRINSPQPPLHTYESSNLKIYCGGNKEAVFFSRDISNQSCLVVAGVGLLRLGNSYKVLSTNDWNSFLSQDEVNLNSVNGHYVAVKFTNNEIKFFTDELGLRDLDIVKLPAGWGFTTRIDWLKYFLNPEIDLKEFGSKWLLQNQISQNSIIPQMQQ